MFSKSVNRVVTTCKSIKNLINVVYNFFFTEYQQNIIIRLKGGGFLFDFVDRLYHISHYKDLVGIGSYTKCKE